MPLAVNPSSYVEYVPKEDRKLPKDKQTVFFIANMSFRDLCDLQDVVEKMFPKPEIRKEIGPGGDIEAMLDLPETDLRVMHESVVKGLKIGLRGWRNFWFRYPGTEGDDDTGLACTWGDQVKDNFSAVPARLCLELIQVCLKTNALTEEEQGNSKSSPELAKEAS